MAGALAAYPFNHWMSRRGFSIWPRCVAASGEAKQDIPTAMPSLRNAWWALLLSVLVLVASGVLALAVLS